jgi:shikimate dehydrogenase
MRKFGLIGKQLSHSFSAVFFNQKFKYENIDAHYDLFELDNIEQFLNLLSEQPDLEGINVTIPYKTEIIKYLNELDTSAQAMQAVNCIKIHNGKTIGYNTDWLGFKKSLEQFLNEDAMHNLKALILGNGGASKAVQYALKHMNIEFTLVGRSEKYDIAYNDINESIIQSHKLIINTTPVGMHPNIDNCIALPYEQLSKEHYLYDLIYNPSITKFLQQGKIRGVHIQNGYEMLVLQALEGWKIWNTNSD